jgi:hypothetical protein
MKRDQLIKELENLPNTQQPMAIIRYHKDYGIAMLLGDNLSATWQSRDFIVFWTNGEQTYLADDTEITYLGPVPFPNVARKAMSTAKTMVMIHQERAAEAKAHMELAMKAGNLIGVRVFLGQYFEHQHKATAAANMLAVFTEEQQNGV